MSRQYVGSYSPQRSDYYSQQSGRSNGIQDKIHNNVYRNIYGKDKYPNDRYSDGPSYIYRKPNDHRRRYLDHDHRRRYIDHHPDHDHDNERHYPKYDKYRGHRDIRPIRCEPCGPIRCEPCEPCRPIRCEPCGPFNDYEHDDNEYPYIYYRYPKSKPVKSYIPYDKCSDRSQ